MLKKKKSSEKGQEMLFGERGRQRRRENNCGRHFILPRFNNAR